MLKVFILISVFYWVDSIPCPEPNPPEFILGYPVCKNGYRELFDCEFKAHIVLKYCYKGDESPNPTTAQPTTTPTDTPTTTPTPTPTTTPTPIPTPTTTPTPTPTPTTTPTPTPTPTTTPTTTPTPTPTTTPTPQPSTTTPAVSTTTPQPTTTPEVTTTNVPSTTPNGKTCGMYPVTGKMWNGDKTTDCQPWLGAIEVMGSLACNAVLVNENTLLTDSFCIDKRRMSANPTVSIGGNEAIPITAEDGIYQLFGKGITVVKLKEKVNTTMNCMNPVCLPQSKEDYDRANCKVTVYGMDENNKRTTFTKHIGLIPKETCEQAKPTPAVPGVDTPDTLCAYPFAQGSSPIERGGMLICKSESSPGRWMLAGLTYDTSMGNLAANQPVYYWDVAKLRKTFEPMLNM